MENDMDNLVADLRLEFQRQKTIAERAMTQVDDADFFRRPGELVNPIALIVKHMAGNLLSRWTDFLTTDGEKPTRDRDGEFLLTDQDTREALMTAWERGWATLFTTLSTMTDADLAATVHVRGEPQTARQALLHAVTHAAYHTGQVLYLVRWARPDSTWLTIAPGQSRGYPGEYRRP